VLYNVSSAYPRRNALEPKLTAATTNRFTAMVSGFTFSFSWTQRVLPFWPFGHERISDRLFLSCAALFSTTVSTPDQSIPLGRQTAPKI
jgi:hypothetical protein